MSLPQNIFSDFCVENLHSEPCRNTLHIIHNSTTSAKPKPKPAWTTEYQLEYHTEDCMEIRKSAKVPQAANLKQTLMKKFSSFGRKQRSYDGGYRVKAPRGHFAVYVRESRSRYIIPISYLAHPDFQVLLQMAADEYMFSHDTGVTIPCDKSLFESLVSVIR